MTMWEKGQFSIKTQLFITVYLLYYILFTTFYILCNIFYPITFYCDHSWCGYLTAIETTINQALYWTLNHVTSFGIILPRRYWIFLTYEDPEAQSC